MAELFDDIKFEAYIIGSTWTDITADVLQNPRPKCGVGILNNGFLDRVQDGNVLTFSLDNSANNSQATRGYYSGLIFQLVRLSFLYDGRRKYKFFGYVPPDGIKVDAGIYGSRKVHITARDWFGLISEYEIDSLAYTTSKRIDEAVPLVVATLPAALQPLYTDYKTGEETFADVFDLTNSNTTIIGELNKLTISEMGYCYMKPNENSDGQTLVVEGRLTRNAFTADTSIPKTSSETTDLFLLANGSDNMLLANGSDKLLLTETQTISMGDADIAIRRTVDVNTGSDYANYSQITLTPRIVDADATSILYTMESSIKVAAGETIDGLVARYRDPSNRSNRVNCIEGTTPVANTDYKAYENEDGTGSDLTANMVVTVTFETAEAKFSIENTGGTDFYTGGQDITFQFRGKGVYVYDTVDYLLEGTNPTLSPYDGRISLNFNMPYFSRIEDARYLIFHTLKGANSRKVIIKKYPLLANKDKKNMMAFMYLEPGTRATFAETMSTYNEESFINGYEFEIIDGKYVYWSPCLFRDDNVNPF